MRTKIAPFTAEVHANEGAQRNIKLLLLTEYTSK